MATLRRLSACVVFAEATAFAISPFALADNAKDIREGRELAEKACSPCHLISSMSPVQEKGPSRPGPPFEEIAKGPKPTLDALRIFLLSTQSTVSHPGAMPNPGLTEEQIRLIASYLSSLRKAK
jgi:mono/diheme cytochrome c family protein